MALPYDLYIRYLITKGIDTENDVNARLKELYLPEIKRKDVERQASNIETLIPQGILSQIENKSYGADFLQWMDMIEVSQLWRKDKPFLDLETRSVMKIVYDIHEDPIRRLNINALLIKRVPHAELAQTVGTRFSCMMQEHHITIYEKFFFDPRRLLRGDWRPFLERCNEAERKIYFTALTETLEVLKSELGLPTSVNVSEVIQTLLTKSYLKAKQYLNLSTKEANTEARAWMAQVVALTEKYEKYRSADSSDFTKNLQMEFEYIDGDFPVPDKETLDELAKDLEKKQAGDTDDEKKETNEADSPEGTSDDGINFG